MEDARELELIVMEIIVHAGNARSLAIEALRSARAGDFSLATEKMAESQQELLESHHAQTDLLVDESNGKPTPISLIMIHAQDHLMNAATVRDLAVEMIAMLRQHRAETAQEKE